MGNSPSGRQRTFALISVLAATRHGVCSPIKPPAPVQSAPKILIVQASVPATKDGDPNVPVANQMAREFDEGGKLNSIVWSTTDPVFREAVSSGKLILRDNPGKPEAIAAAHVLGAEYIVIFTAYRAGRNVRSETTLLHGGKVEWRDHEDMAVDRGGAADPELSAQSVARTIVLKMANKALVGLPVLTKARTPDAAPGQLPVVAVAPTPAPLADDAALQSSVDAMLKDKNVSGAIGAVRDAVDESPFDPKRRIMLYQLLLDRDPAHAADEAHRASLVLPDHGEFRLMAARAWMQAGRAKEAQDELNEAVAHAPDAPATRLLLAEVALGNLQPERALPHLEQAIKSDPSGQAFFLRSLCRSMLGGVDGTKLDMEAMLKAEPSPTPGEVAQRHRMAVSIFDQLLVRDANAIRDLIQKAAIKPKDAGVHDDLAAHQKSLAARIDLMEMLACPPEDQRAHDRWLLAGKLLAQSIVDIETFTGGNADDSLTDARINLGEALKQAEVARSK